MAYAEVIGDPVRHSLSPRIHAEWLRALGITGEFRATPVARDGLDSYFAGRRRDGAWRGCSVTLPHKQAVVRHLDRIEEEAAQVGAVNCVYRHEDGLIGTNTDLDGIAAALGTTAVAGRKIVLIGGGGAARAALHYFRRREAAQVCILVRNPAKASHLREAGAATRVETGRLDEAEAALAQAAILVNASPLGMAGAPEMPEALLAALAGHGGGITVFDMVYGPVETRFLAAARANGAVAVDGMTMLIGQAREAFERFFGRTPPADVSGLRARLATARP